MTKTVELAVAQSTLSEIIAGLGPNDEIVIVQDHKPVARLSPPKQEGQPRQPGLMKDKLVVVAEDDEHLKDFEEYM